jgi:hypothetical protein
LGQARARARDWVRVRARVRARVRIRGGVRVRVGLGHLHGHERIHGQRVGARARQLALAQTVAVGGELGPEAE